MPKPTNIAKMKSVDSVRNRRQVVTVTANYRQKIAFNRAGRDRRSSAPIVRIVKNISPSVVRVLRNKFNSVYFCIKKLLTKYFLWIFQKPRGAPNP